MKLMGEKFAQSIGLLCRYKGFYLIHLVTNSTSGVFKMITLENEAQPRSIQTQESIFIEEKAFRSRMVLVFGNITDTIASETVRRLLTLDAESSAPITMIISSPGGHLESGDVIHDVSRFVSSPVNMVGTGWVGSAATHLYLGAPVKDDSAYRRRVFSFISQVVELEGPPVI